MLFVTEGSGQESQHHEIFLSYLLPERHSLQSWPPPWRRPAAAVVGSGATARPPTPPQPGMLRTPSVFFWFPPWSPMCTESKRILEGGLRFSIPPTHSPSRNSRSPGSRLLSQQGASGASALRPPSPSCLVLPSPRVPS